MENQDRIQVVAAGVVAAHALFRADLSIVELGLPATDLGPVSAVSTFAHDHLDVVPVAGRLLARCRLGRAAAVAGALVRNPA